MRTRRRHRLALAVSLGLHLVVLAGPAARISCIPEVELPEIEFEWTEVDLLDPEALQGEQEQVPKEPEPAPPEPTPTPPEPTPPEPVDETAGSEPEPPPPEPEAPPKPAYAEKGSRAAELSPPESTFHMLLVTKRIRGLPFAQQVLDIMAPLPDFELLIDGGRFDALRDFDHIVIASPRINDELETFLAVDYKMPREEVQRAIERAVASRNETIEWVSDGGPLRGNPRPIDPEEKDIDDRWFVFLEDKKVAVYMRAKFLPYVLSDEEGDDRKTAANFVSKLTKMRSFAARQPGSGLQLVISGIRRGAKGTPKIGGKPLPFALPDEIELSASASVEPEVVLRVGMANNVEAKAFVKWWEEDLQEILDDSLSVKLSVGWMYDLFEIERDGNQVRLRGQMTTAQAEKVMQFAADGSRKVAKKTPEEVAEMRRRRLEALEARKGGKLPPSVLDAKAEPEPDDPAAPGRDDPGEAEPPRTPLPSVGPADAPAPRESPEPTDPVPPPAAPPPPGTEANKTNIIRAIGDSANG